MEKFIFITTSEKFKAFQNRVHLHIISSKSWTVGVNFLLQGLVIKVIFASLCDH